MQSVLVVRQACTYLGIYMITSRIDESWLGSAVARFTRADLTVSQVSFFIAENFCEVRTYVLHLYGYVFRFLPSLGLSLSFVCWKKFVQGEAIFSPHLVDRTT